MKQKPSLTGLQALSSGDPWYDARAEQMRPITQGLSPMWANWYDKAWEATGGETDPYGNKNLNLRSGRDTMPTSLQPLAAGMTTQTPILAPPQQDPYADIGTDELVEGSKASRAQSRKVHKGYGY